MLREPIGMVRCETSGRNCQGSCASVLASKRIEMTGAPPLRAAASAACASVATWVVPLYDLFCRVTGFGGTAA